VLSAAGSDEVLKVMHVIRNENVRYISFVAELTYLESRRNQLSMSFFQDTSQPSSSPYRLLPPLRDTSVLSILGSEQPHGSHVLSHVPKHIVLLLVML